MSSQEIEQLNEFKTHNLPLARIKKIMKSDEDVRMISSEAPALFARACETFILEASSHARLDQERFLCGWLLWFCSQRQTSNTHLCLLPDSAPAPPPHLPTCSSPSAPGPTPRRTSGAPSSAATSPAPSPRRTSSTSSWTSSRGRSSRTRPRPAGRRQLPCRCARASEPPGFLSPLNSALQNGTSSR